MESQDVTYLLAKWREGDRGALDSLTPLVYEELRRIADAQLKRERSDHTLAPTALVHEAWMKLAKGNESEFASRGHFYALASRIMRNVLIDHARRLQSEKHGGKAITVTLAGVSESAAQPMDFLVLNDAIDRLAKMNPRQAKVLEMRYFGGLGLEEIAGITGSSASTIMREQRAAEAWLAHTLLG
ncbi:MAG: sigma-70 family RNA polymerase sigma factor [Bryobacteraceae bacterium]